MTLEIAHIPDLKFPTVEFGERETPWNLAILLYKGGAKANARRVGHLLATGRLGAPLPERFDLVQKIHAEINGKLAGGGSKLTADNEIGTFRQFFSWAERSKQSLALSSIQQTYLQWADYLIYRHRVIKNISERSTYQKGAVVGAILDSVLDRQTPLIQLTRLRMPPQRKTARGVQAEKQSLGDTFTFGHLLQDMCDGLSLEVVLKGALPARVSLRAGKECVLWSGARRTWAHHAVADRQGDGTLRTRFPLANLRIEAEMLMFIGQTGINFSQAQHLRLRSFFYASHLDGYQVKDRKYRRGGEVLFEIFKDYKPHFERYLAWRRELFPDSEQLFPFIRAGGRSSDTLHQFRLRFICNEVEIPFVSPRSLRNTRVNWLLRNSSDPNLTADMAQHAKQTLLTVYERPSQQRAIGELMRFWTSSDPHFANTVSVGPGACDGHPVPAVDIPTEAPEPDCVRPSGCLWCDHHRDVDDQDYVWSLASFRHLKLIELSKWNAPRDTRESHPAKLVVDRISEKMRWFQSSNDLRRSWVTEALTRIDESWHHPAWRGIVEQLEGPA